MRDVKISKVMNGFTVRVGCQTLVFESRDGLIAALDAYLRSPEEVEKQFVTKYGFANAEPVPQPAPEMLGQGTNVMPTPATPGLPLPGYTLTPEVRNW